jgi:hypothetical protein
MKISELILFLEEIQIHNGDLPVFVWGATEEMGPARAVTLAEESAPVGAVSIVPYCDL